jgi:hypothetical protein
MGLAFGEDRHRRVVAVQALGSEDMRLDSAGLADRAPDLCPDCGGRMELIASFPRSRPMTYSAWHDSS